MKMNKLLSLVLCLFLLAAFKPIATTTPQYEDTNGNPFSGAVLKAFKAGTTTNILMATDSTGLTTATSMALNSNGYPELSGTIVIPHIDEAYKLSLFPTQAAADSNTGAIWTIDNLSIGTTLGDSTVDITTNTVLTQATHCNAQLNVTNTVTLTLPAVASVANNCIFTMRNAGTGVVTLDGDGSETINGTTTITFTPGTGATVIAGSTAWSSIGDKAAQIDGDNTFTNDNTFSGDVAFLDEGELTIATGAITVTAVNHTIDTESDAATDDLDTVNGGTDGMLLFMSTENDARDVVIKHNTGNILTPDGQDFTLATTQEATQLIFSAALSKWQVVTVPFTRAAVVEAGVITLEASQVTTSGTVFDFNVASGAKTITVSLEDVSLSGSDDILIQFSDAGGVETSGYKSTSTLLSSSTGTTSGSTSGFVLERGGVAALTFHGSYIFTLLNSSTNTWVGQSVMGRGDTTTSTIFAGGSKSLSAEITQVRLTRTGSNTFDLGNAGLTHSK